MSAYKTTTPMTTYTGMTLRSGKTYNNTDNQCGPDKYELDGADFISLDYIAEYYGRKWVQKVYEILACNEEWTYETAYLFLAYLESTSENWCNVAHEAPSQDAYEFGVYLMSLVSDFSEQATTIKRYPNTRNKIIMFGDYLGYCNGIIRLASKIMIQFLNSEENAMAEAEENAMAEAEHQQEAIEYETPINLESKKQEEDFNYWSNEYKNQGGYGHA